MVKVFILGNPRSGTSLFRLMLNQHSKIVAPPESGFMQWWLKKYKNWKTEHNITLRLDDFLNDLYSSSKFETWEINKNKLKNFIISMNPGSYGELIGCVYLFYSERPEKVQVVADKNNYYVHHIDDLQIIWPDAKYIHIIRDGRDVACSYLDIQKLRTNSPYKPKLPFTINEIAKEWINNNQNIAKLAENSSENYMLVKYEDIITDTKVKLSRVSKFIGVEYEDSMLEYYKHSTAKKCEPKETLDWKRKTLEKPDPSKINRYERDLSAEQIEQYNYIASKILKSFGYYV